MKFPLKNRIQTVIFKLKRLVVLFFRRLGVENMLAVHDNDLDGLLKQLGLFDGLNSGAYKCSNCGCTISRNNLGVISNENNATVFYCISTGCGGQKSNTYD